MSSRPFPVRLSFSEESFSTTVRKPDMSPTISPVPAVSGSLFAWLICFASPTDDLGGLSEEVEPACPHLFSCLGELSTEDEEEIEHFLSLLVIFSKAALHSLTFLLSDREDESSD